MTASGKASNHQLTAITFQNRSIKQKILDIATIDENGNVVAVGTSSTLARKHNLKSENPESSASISTIFLAEAIP